MGLKDQDEPDKLTARDPIVLSTSNEILIFSDMYGTIWQLDIEAGIMRKVKIEEKE